MRYILPILFIALSIISCNGKGAPTEINAATDVELAKRVAAGCFWTSPVKIDGYGTGIFDFDATTECECAKLLMTVEITKVFVEDGIIEFLIASDNIPIAVMITNTGRTATFTTGLCPEAMQTQFVFYFQSDINDYKISDIWEFSLLEE